MNLDEIAILMTYYTLHLYMFTERLHGFPLMLIFHVLSTAISWCGEADKHFKQSEMDDIRASLQPRLQRRTLNETNPTLVDK